MILLDVNVLLYAYAPDVPEHLASRRWLDGALNGVEPIGIPWPTIWAFIRISTNPRAASRPVQVDEAASRIRNLLNHAGVAVPNPTSRHLEISTKLASKYRISGSRFSDVVLAALAVEHGAALASTDSDFAKFQEVRWINPLAPNENTAGKT